MDIAHVVGRIGAAKLTTEPFNYFVAENVFSADDYAEILRQIPAVSFFPDVAQSVKRLDLIPDPVSDGGGKWTIDTRIPNEPQFAFWNAFREAFLSKRVQDAIMAKLDIHPRGEASSSARVGLDLINAGLGPHRDRPDKLASIIISLPKTPLTEEQSMQSGTDILVPVDPNQEFDDRHYKFSEFKTIDYAPYRANQLFAFRVERGENGRHSFHAYHQKADIERFTIKMHIHDQAMIEEGFASQTAARKVGDRDWAREKGITA